MSHLDRSSMMMQVLLLCAALTACVWPIMTDCVCTLPDTKKSYVTTLALNMARSVGPCVTPDPSVLLALNLGKVPDPPAREILIKLLKDDAAKRVTEDLPFSSGKVALYVLALRSSCCDPTKISGPDGNIDLVHLLETKTREELINPEPLTTWYQVALDVITLCVMSKPSAITAAETMANNIPENPSGHTQSVDTAAVVVLGYTCVLRMNNVPHTTFTKVKASMAKFLDLILNSNNNGILGNTYSTGLAGQALTAAKPFYPSHAWNCSQTLNAVLDLIPQGTFSLPISAAQLLPFLWGKTYLSVKDVQCTYDNASLIPVEYTIVNDLSGDHFKYSVTVEVVEGSTLLQVMQKARELNPKDFSFLTEETNWGPFVTSINHLDGSNSDHTYWQFFSDTTPLSEGVGTYKPKKNEHILAVFSKY